MTTKKLRAGRPYVVTVRGTLSAYRWRASHVACGMAEDRPIYKSRGAKNGIVSTYSVTPPALWGVEFHYKFD